MGVDDPCGDSLIFSGIQPTGSLHLGNYLGAVTGWLGLQGRCKSIFCIADLHSITVTQDPGVLKSNSFMTAALYLACGLDPKQSVIFVQSQVPDHAELAWILGTRVPLGWLNRMTQYKDKAKLAGKQCLGLYSYPVLMASDILLYGTTHVPVGEDQKQHIELTRNIAQAFNNDQGKELFTLPEPLISEDGCRIMSLRDGRAKMSKSDPSENSRILLADSDELIASKISKAKTDSCVGFDYQTLASRPEAENLISILSAVTGVNKATLCTQYDCFSALKKDLTEAIIMAIKPIREELSRLRGERKYVEKVVAEGRERAAELSQLRKIKKELGLE